MACKMRQDAIGQIGQIKWCFTKVPPCGRARLKLCGNRVTSVQSVLSCFRVLSLHIGQIFCNMHRITDGHVIRKPVTRVMRASPYILQALLMSDYRRGCPSSSWVDLERLCGIDAPAYMVRCDARSPLYGRGRGRGQCRPACRCAHLDVGDALQLPGRIVRCLCPASM